MEDSVKEKINVLGKWKEVPLGQEGRHLLSIMRREERYGGDIKVSFRVCCQFT